MTAPFTLFPKPGSGPVGIYQCLRCPDAPMSWSQHCPKCNDLRTRIGTYDFDLGEGIVPRYEETLENRRRA